MAEREAAVRLTLRSGAFVGGLRQVSAQVQRVGAKMGAALSAPMMAGLKGAKAAALGLGSSIKSTLSSAAKFGGAFAVGAAAKKGLELQQTYANIAFNLSKATGEARSWQDVQKAIEPVALKTSRTSAEMAEAFATVFEATGDVDYAAASLETIGQTANATGYSVEHLANAAQIMQRKFGASKDEIPEMMARFVEKVGVGGASIEGMGNKFALMAGEASAAGLKGKEGLSQLLGVMIALDSRVGEKAEPGLKRMLQVLKKGSTEMKRLKKETGLEFDPDAGAFDKLRNVMSGKGRVAMEAILTGESRTVFDELARPFDEAMKAAKDRGASTEEATKAGMAAFDKAMAEAGRSQLTSSKIAVESAKRAEDPQRKLAMAMETFAQEFTKPEMLEAMSQLAKSLPKLARGMAKLVEFTVNHPVLAAGGYAGMRVGGGFVAGSVQNIGVSGAKKAGETIGEVAAKHPAWASAGTSFAAAAGPVIAAWITKEMIDAAQDEGEKAGKKEFSADIAALNLRSKVRAQGGKATDEDIRKAKQIMASMKDQQEDSMSRTISRRLGFGDSATGVVNAAVGGSGTGRLLSLLYESAKKSSSGVGAGAATLEGGTSAADYRAQMRDFIRSVSQASAELSKIKTPEGNGLPGEPGKEPGYDGG